MASISEYYDFYETKQDVRIDKLTMFEIYSHLDQLKGCEFHDAKFIDEDMGEISRIISIEL